ncbi:hypothetical protein [Thiorhodococcus mannitoliphagus]|nr:hypothetical protein [Thiorhodococcus mannitoliphagus]
MSPSIGATMANISRPGSVTSAVDTNNLNTYRFPEINLNSRSKPA